MSFLPHHGGGPSPVDVRWVGDVVIRTYPQGLAGGSEAAAGRASGPGGRLSAVVLAAGEGTRMRSARPKPLHRLCGRPMVLHVLDALAELSVARVVVVVGHRAEWVTKTLVEHAPPGMAIEFVEQVEQRGTGDAMAVALTGLPDEEGDDDGDVVVLPGDTPLLRPATLAALVHQHRVSDNAATLLTAELDDPTGYGRVVRGRDDSVARVVEHVDASDDELEVREINTSIYCFRRERPGSVAAQAEPGQCPGRALPDRCRRRALRGGSQGGVRAGRRHHGGGRGQRPGPAGGGRSRAAGQDQREVDAPRRHHVGPRADLYRCRCRDRPRCGHAPRGHPAGVMRRRGARRAGPRRPSGRHGGGGGRTGGVQRRPALGDRRQRPRRPVRRPRRRGPRFPPEG